MPTLQGFRWYPSFGAHSSQANEAIAFERIIFSENKDYNSFFRVAVNPYIPIFRGLDVRG